MKRFVILLFVMCTLSLIMNSQEQVQTDQEGFSYEVNVDAQLVPIFAVDKDGNPVYDLAQGDFELYADGKLTEIISFNYYKIESSEKTPGKTGETQETQPLAPPPVQPEKSPERLNFIIIDSIASNRTVLKPAIEMVKRIIDNASPGDGFVLLESRNDRGIDYLIGPEKDKTKLFGVLNHIENSFLARQTNIARSDVKELLTAGYNNNRYKTIDGKMEAAAINFGVAMRIAETEKKQYTNDIRIFSDSIQQLKYALKTIPLPKTFFLISAGPLGVERSAWTMSTYKHLIKAAEAINLGGSMLYIINPIAANSLSERNAFKFMSDSVNGKFIYGQDFDKVVEQVKKSTSAYYELAFYSNKKPDHVSNIKVKCKRDNVSLVSIGYSEKSRPYRKMNTTEKELFALSVINRGSWSRIVAKVGRLPYTKINKTESKKEPNIIQLDIPPFMRNRKADVFIIHMDPKTLEADFEFQQKLMTDTETIEVQPRKKRDAYFVIIEPKIPVCIYNQVM
jgi:VWFA-related protein